MSIGLTDLSPAVYENNNFNRLCTRYYHVKHWISVVVSSYPREPQIEQIWICTASCWECLNILICQIIALLLLTKEFKSFPIYIVTPSYSMGYDLDKLQSLLCQKTFTFHFILTHWFLRCFEMTQAYSWLFPLGREDGRTIVQLEFQSPNDIMCQLASKLDQKFYSRR